ncbi:MAG: methylated-DNA--[protein]-cysteine S-methyltransferase [Deltaproteobacteria bacterium]|nr:methylated-DNA--[protein]-cysteine S-methyltransferase [Deltaproteobacteria bacterium]
MAERWGLSLKRDASRFAKIFKALDGYFKGGDLPFGLPLSPTGTEFEIKVWKALARIPWGEVRSYGQVASHIGRPKAARAVGNACGQNPIPIIIPCHRVLKGDGGIGGYTGGIGIKKFLLELEGIGL